MSEVVVVALFTVKEGMVEEAIERFTPVIEHTHGEEGCLAYALHRDVNDPSTLALVERWKSQDDLNSHFGMPYMAEVGAIASELLTEPPRIVFSEPLPLGDPAKGSL
ncbi:MAG: putative quinol monooxygenase [Solirubrobacterales bacterium]